MAPHFRRSGDVAKRTGVSVRTLRYYDEIHLLSPSQHTASRYRLYTAADIARLQQIKSLQQLGFSLEDIRTCLSRPDASFAGVFHLHPAHLRERVELERKLCDRLERLAAHVPSDTDVSLDTMLDATEMMNMIEKYYTPEQIDQLRERQREVGEERIRRAEAQWKDFTAQVGARWIPARLLPARGCAASRRDGWPSWGSSRAAIRALSAPYALSMRQSPP